MTSVSPVTASSILEEIETIALELNENELLESVRAIRDHNQAAKLRLLVVGATGSGRSALVNLLLGDAGLLPRSPVPKPAVGVEIRHGEQTEVTRVGKDGTSLAVAPDQIRSLIMNADAARDERVEIHVPCDVLRTCDVRIESLEAGYAAGKWRNVLAAIDYVALVLNAGALLSEAERGFIREYLATDIGLERVAIVINQMDLVPEEERSSLVDLVRTFLGPYQSQPAIIELAARDASFEDPPAVTLGHESLATLLHDILEQRIPLRSTAIRRALNSSLSELKLAASRSDALYALADSDLHQIRETLASQQTHLDGRITRTQARVEAFVQTLLKEQLLRRIEGFGKAFHARLPREIESVDDAAMVRRHVSGYIETVWGEFLRGQMLATRADLADEETRINEIIGTDIESLLENVAREKVDRLHSLGPDAPAFHVFVMPSRGKHRAATVARGLSLNGFLMLFVAPPIGVISLAASQLLQRAYQGNIRQAERDAMVASAVAASRELEREIKTRVDHQFSDLSDQLQDDVVAAYRQGVDQIVGMLDERAAHHNELSAKREEITGILRERLPRLEATVERIGYDQMP